MAEVRWIKLMVDVFNNRKLEQIEVMPDGDGIIVVWFKLLCLAGNVNDDGAIYFTQEVPYTEEMLSTQFRRPIALVRLALRVFLQFGMVTIVENIIHISNWEKYQNAGKLNEIRDYNRLAQQKHRAQKKLQAPVNDMSMTSQTCQGTDIEIEVDIDRDKSSTRAVKPPSARKFVPPTIDEVRAYCLERKNTVNPDKWMDHYISNGWMVGRNKMRDWKAAVRKWEGNDYGRTGQSVVGTGTGRDESEKLHSKYNGTVV